MPSGRYEPGSGEEGTEMGRVKDDVSERGEEIDGGAEDVTVVGGT